MPAPYDDENNVSGLSSGYNRTPFASIMASSLTGGWYSAGGSTLYNRFSGQTMSGSDFNFGALPGFSFHGTNMQGALLQLGIHAGTAELTFVGGTGRNLGYFKGFEGHLFHFDAASGKFYLPHLETEINPIDVLTGKIQWIKSLSQQLDELYSYLPAYTNTTPYDPPFPVDNTIESLLIPLPAIFKGIKLARAAKIAKSGAGTLSANPFRGKSFRQIDRMFKAKGFTVKGPSPMSGRGSYFNPNSGTRYYLDHGGMYRKGFENPHVDIWYTGHPTFEKVIYFLDDLSKIYTLH